MPNTCYFIGGADLKTKVLRASDPVSTAAVKIGLPGGPYVSLASWDAEDVVAAWNAINHALRNRVTASVDGTEVVFTAGTAGEDFHIRAYISGAAEADIPQITADVSGGGPTFFMNEQNWKNGVIPGSGDTIIIDEAQSAILYDIDLVQPFVKFDVSGGFVRWQLSNKKQTFVSGQKVYVVSSGTLPSGLTTGYYYVLNATTDGMFHLSTTTSNADRITSSDAGTGNHRIGLREMDVRILARYAGAQIGLPQRRASLPEYLPTHLNCWFDSLVIGDAILGGNGLTLGRFDCEDSAVSDGLVVHQSVSPQGNIPPIELLINNSTTVLRQYGGSVALAPYPGQTCVLDHIEQNAGDILISNTTTDARSRLLGTYKIYNSTIAGVLNNFEP